MRIQPVIFHECDILAVSEAGYATEVEIKISISDLKADFKKEHNHKSEVIKNFYYCVPENLLEKALPIIPLTCGILLATEIGIKKYRTCKKNKKARAMSEREIAEIWRLSMFRYLNSRK
ncbi:DNA repair protein MmcB-related protein [Leptotrichia sp. OH3620_COT-345]|nr:DNA repair protein MmcB-related protein [Leptotrichia sp. OH3620_COT-345]